jgi:hypothetical protein
VLITDADGQSIQLSPDGYQFPDLSRNRWDGWDENWLMVAGEVSQGLNKRWSFRDPILTAAEAVEIAPWLRHAAEGSIPVTHQDSNGRVSPDLYFVEPNVSFSVAGRSDSSVQVRVHFSQESAPPWLDWEERIDNYSFFVELFVSSRELEAAADVWDQELKAFPDRSA